MKRLKKWAAFAGGSFLVAAIGLVVYLGMNRIVVIADTGSASELTGVSEKEGLPGDELSLEKGSGEEHSIMIPLESAADPENITIENQYMDRRLVIHIKEATGFFYKNNEIAGYVEPVQAASYVEQGGGVTLYLQFSELFEYESILDNGCLRVNLYKPSEKYEKVLILDVDISDDLDDQEKAGLYQIEEKLQVLLEEEGIRVYSAFDKNKEIEPESKRMLAEQTEADLYVGLMFDKDEDPEMFGSYVCYSSLYFRPWLTNGSFADKMEQALVTSIQGKALGIVEVEDDVLQMLSIPAVTVCPGYVSSQTEGKLLLDESYQEKIAEGIFEGILGTYEELEE